jgi:hypothetical protein
MHDEDHTAIIRDNRRNGQEIPCLFCCRIFFPTRSESGTVTTSSGTSIGIHGIREQTNAGINTTRMDGIRELRSK